MTAFPFRPFHWLAASGFALAVAFSSGSAWAVAGQVVLVSGEVVAGDITQVIPGQSVTVQTPGGEVKVIGWAQIGSYQVGAGAAIVIGGGQQPAPPPAAAPPPPPPPPAPVYTAPPPPPPPPARPPFQPAWTLGIRLGSLVPGNYIVGKDVVDNNTGLTRPSPGSVPMSDYVKPGWSIEGQVGFRFSPSWTVYGFWEHGRLQKGSKNFDASEGGVTNQIGLGLNVNTSPRGPVGLLLDGSIGYRWMTFAYQVPVIQGINTYDRAVLHGPQLLRLGIGLAINMSRHFRLDVLAQGSIGVFTSWSLPGGACVNPDRNYCDVVPQSQQGAHTFVGLTAGARWDLLQ